MTAPWFIRSRPRPEARLRLICFPYAGMGASVFARWQDLLPPEIEVWGVQTPGRESRLREQPLQSLPRLAEEIAAAAAPLLTGTFAMFGHSMGAPLAFETTVLLARAGHTAQHLFVSGRRPPHVPDPDPPLRHLSDAEFVDEIARRYNAIPDAIRNDEELLALLLPALRGDIAALETHHVDERPRLAIPVTAYGGDMDPRALPEHIEAWRESTTGAFRMRLFPGGHFYLTEQRMPLVADIAATLAPIVAATTSGAPT